MKINHEIGDRQGEGAVLGNLGIAHARLGQVEQATDYYEQQLAIAREIGDRRGEENALGNMGIAYADWARWSGPSAIISSIWSSLARSATGVVRGPPWATWEMPTSTWARFSGPSAITSSD